MLQAIHGYTSPVYLNFSFSIVVGLGAGSGKFYRRVHGFMTGINKMKEARMEVIIIDTFAL